MTLRARLALSMAVLAGVIAIFVAVTTYVSTDNRLRAEVDRYLDSYGQRYQDPDGRQAAITCSPPNARRLPPTIAGGDESVEGVAFQCVNQAGAVVSSIGVQELPVDARDTAIAATGRGKQIRTADADGKTWRIETVGVSTGGAVQIARDYGETERVLSSLRLGLLLIVLAAVSIGALIGWLVARRATKPLVQLTDAAEEVATTGRLDVDVPPAGKDEPGRLARAFATMLAALGQSREQQQQLVQDAGHELRTPLTSLRTNVETLQRYGDLPVETRQTILADLQTETRELGALVDELVQLATDTYDDEPEESVSIDQIAGRVAERVRRRTGRTVTIDAQPSVIVGRPRELTRAIGNLVDNAAKFSEAPTSVEVVVRPGSVIVRDHGPGVAAEDQPHVFDRFFRSAAARSKPGSGLGLAIVDQVARNHGGSVIVRNHPDGGAEFTILLPVDAESPPGSGLDSPPPPST
jgi:two-component system sensor histidine kinase MprB